MDSPTANPNTTLRIDFIQLCDYATDGAPSAAVYVRPRTRRGTSGKLTCLITDVAPKASIFCSPLKSQFYSIRIDFHLMRFLGKDIKLYRYDSRGLPSPLGRGDVVTDSAENVATLGAVPALDVHEVTIDAESQEAYIVLLFQDDSPEVSPIAFMFTSILTLSTIKGTERGARIPLFARKVSNASPNVSRLAVCSFFLHVYSRFQSTISTAELDSPTHLQSSPENPSVHPFASVHFGSAENLSQLALGGSQTPTVRQVWTDPSSSMLIDPIREGWTPVNNLVTDKFIRIIQLVG